MKPEDMNFSNEFLYIVDSLVINDIEIDPTYFETLITRKNFYNHRFPIKILILSLPVHELHEIVSTVDISRPVVNVDYRMKVTANDKGEGEGELFERGSYIGLLDEAYLNYASYVNIDDELKNDASVYGDQKQIRIGLYNEKDLNSFKYGYVNNVYKNFNVATLLVRGYQECTDGMPLYISPPDNKHIYRQDLIIPMGFFDFINYVDNEMGIYDTGYNVFLEEGETYILSKNNKHKMEPKGMKEEKYVNTIFVDKPTDLNPNIGADISSGVPSKYFKVKFNSLNHVMETQNFGRFEEFYSDIHNMYFTEGENSYDNITDTKIVSNRFKKHKKKKHGVQNFVVQLDNLPFKAKPYEYIALIGEGEGMNQVYRITDYLNIISKRNSYTRINIKRLTDKL